MSLDSTEEEQIDQIKRFFKENGLFMLMAIILVVGGNVGYDYYKTSERTTAEAASLDFSNFQKAVDEVVANGSGRDDALAMGEAIKVDHPGTAYAALGALQLARLYFDDKAYAEAEAELSFAVDSNIGLIAPLARIRLAKVISAQSEFERALQALPSVQAVELSVAPGSAMEPTRDISATDCGQVRLVHPDPAVLEADYEAIVAAMPLLFEIE